MPSETAVFNRTLTNLGPLTTAFTPAPSCTALPSQSDAGFIFWHRTFDGDGPANGADVPYGSVACTPQDLATCYPSGAARQSILASGGYEFTQPYHSPGYRCPAGWTAVASASYDDAWSELSALAHNLSAPAPRGYDAVVTAFAISALAPSETVTVCCPSGYEPFAGDYEVQFGCTSSLGPASSRGVSERCFNDRPTTTVTFGYWNGRVTKIEPVSDAPTKYTQLPLETGMSYEVVHTMPNVVLINKGDDAGGEAASPTTTLTGTGAGKDGKKNAASGLRVNLPVAATVLVGVASFLGL
ncbi:hypothetical protein ISF_00933 [Cordyceps fumosorosea ARSEF 2679]|uniref:Uncharacterized protein n=1 Tax=Cordyceps fumosorosea (strain ARSEF 2679) TaxID=1081104 RepID=A0A162JUN5_CORFA|nr:hypothetical protein ISF_00933 [Cordyceps fumosorosea ARSEF 2679]OAA74032.1 hypothetical protein ISF_00933 [Cordyceps fumosorosea ARSEF 2679]